MPPTFSIIIPVYNVAPYLAECLDSVRAQTYANWEALCVNDGSSDTSSTLLDTYARLDPRIHVTHQRNAGVSSARNRALDIAHGDWIWFIDSDDAIHPDALRLFAELLGEAGKNVDGIGFKLFVEGANLPERWKPLESVWHHCFEPDMQSLWHFWGSAWRTLFSRELIGKSRFMPYRMGEDLLFSVSRFMEMKHWILVDAQCYFYRAREGSAMRSRPRLEVVKDWFDVQSRLLHLLGDSGIVHKMGGGKDLFVRLWGGWLYYSESGMFFRLPLREMRKCYVQWLDDLALYTNHWQLPLRKKIPFLILRQIHSMLLARALVYWPLLLWKRFLRA